MLRDTENRLTSSKHHIREGIRISESKCIGIQGENFLSIKASQQILESLAEQSKHKTTLLILSWNCRTQKWKSLMKDIEKRPIITI